MDLRRPPSPGDRSFSALVERVGCNNGVTGEVLVPEVVEEPDQVIVTFTVAQRAAGAANCLGNKPVPTEVTLTAAVGERTLVDGACLSGQSVTTSHCLDGAERWPPGEERVRPTTACGPGAARRRGRGPSTCGRPFLSVGACNSRCLSGHRSV
jgi:hypothetical protein